MALHITNSSQFFSPEYLSPQFYADNAVAKPLLGVAFTALSLLVTVACMVALDITKCYVTPPKSFPGREWRSVFFKPKVKAPLVVPKPGAKDFREVLERGSRLVGGLHQVDSPISFLII
jgi:hypothetical protein